MLVPGDQMDHLLQTTVPVMHMSSYKFVTGIRYLQKLVAGGNGWCVQKISKAFSKHPDCSVNCVSLGTEQRPERDHHHAGFAPHAREQHQRGHASCGLDHQRPGLRHVSRVGGWCRSVPRPRGRAECPCVHRAGEDQLAASPPRSAGGFVKAD